MKKKKKRNSRKLYKKSQFIKTDYLKLIETAISEERSDPLYKSRLKPVTTSRLFSRFCYTWLHERLLNTPSCRDSRMQRKFNGEEKPVFYCDVEKVPLYINHILPGVRAIAKWRLLLGK